MCFYTFKIDEKCQKKNCAYFHAYIWPSHWHRQLKFGQHIANNLSWHHVKFYGNARCLSSPYLASNLRKCSKIDVFFNLLVNISQNNRPRKLNFGGHLGDMLHYLPIKFEVYMPKNGHFGQFFLGRWKLDISDFHQILQEGNVTCPLSAHRNSAF